VGQAGFAHYFGWVVPEQKRVFFTEDRGNGNWMVSQSLEDGALRDLSPLPRGSNHVRYTRNGDFAIFHNTLDDRRKIYLQNTATGALRVLASGEEDIGFPHFSRDDKWIAAEVTHRTSGGDDVVVIPANGGEPEVIVKSDQPSYAAGWMPDNDRILYA